MSRVLTAALVASLALAVSGCGKKKVETLPPAPGNEQTASQTGSGAIVPGSQADFMRQMAGGDTIFFDTDRFNIDAVDAAALQAQAQWLVRYPNKRARLEGHADERGTREYNLALGERRANAAKNYLASLGVDPSRIAVISFGKERPAALGSDEAAWARNRRAVTITID